MLVTLPGLDWTEEKAVWLKALSEAGVAVKLIPPNLSELPAWIAGRFQMAAMRFMMPSLVDGPPQTLMADLSSAAPGPAIFMP